MNEAVREMNNLGWRFTDKHLILNVSVDGRNHRVAIPIQRVDSEVTSCVGQCDPEGPSVGAMFDTDLSTSSVGFFKKIGRAFKRAAKSVSRGAKKAFRRVVPKGVRRAGRRLYRKARRLVRKALPAVKSIIRSKALTGVLVAASYVPGAAAITMPAVAAQQAARQALRVAERGYQAQKLIRRGIRNPRVFAQRAAGLQAVNRMRRTAQQAARGNRRALHQVAATQRLLGRGPAVRR